MSAEGERRVTDEQVEAEAKRRWEDARERLGALRQWENLNEPLRNMYRHEVRMALLLTEDPASNFPYDTAT